MALTFRPFLQCCLLLRLRVRIPQQQSGPNPYTVKKNEIHNINKTESKHQIDKNGHCTVLVFKMRQSLKSLGEFQVVCIV